MLTREGPPPRTVYLAGGLILAALIVAAAVIVAVDRLRTGPAHEATGPVAGRDTATLDLLGGAGSVTVRAAGLGDTLYRVRSSATPSVVESGDRVDVRIAGSREARAGDASVTIELNRDVRWTVRFTGGAQSNVADLRQLRRLAGVQYVGGVSSIELTLPEPAGTVPVRVDGGAGAVRIHAPDTVPVRVRAGAGAGGVTIDGAAHNGVAAGAVFPSGGWDAARDRYDVDAATGISTVVVDRSMP